ncbi:MAG: LysE family translocator [Alphaproteobacteria bacterium]|nr:LysE family translocator [Alphaproteobacteria bacterium]
MSFSLYLTFVLATSVLILIPGPNVALIVANAVSFGTSYGLLTVAGTSAAMVIQLVLVVLGMTALMGAAAQWFEWIRWLGVAYLLWIGVRQWMAAPVDLTLVQPDRKPVREIFLRGALVSMTNPKTLVFYGAFFPQFITADAAIGPQLALLCGTFLAIAILLDGAWAIAAGRARGFLARRGRLRNRLAGGLLMGAGVGLALARVK